jgi:hypothetical protein
MNKLKLAAIVAAGITAWNANATLVIINAYINGAPSYGFPSVNVVLPAGDYTATLVQNQGDPYYFKAWSWAYGSVDTWTTQWRADFRDGDNPLNPSVNLVGGSDFLPVTPPYGRDSAADAFDNALNTVVTFTLAQQTTLHFYIWDNYLADNTGGVTLNIEAAAVPEPSTYIAGALMLLPFGATVIRSVHRKSKV